MAAPVALIPEKRECKPRKDDESTLFHIAPYG